MIIVPDTRGAMLIPDATSHNMARLMLNAQEEERTRIGRELHDGIGQEVALLMAKLRSVAESVDTNDEVASELFELCNKAQRIANAMRDLSHDLHPAKLEYLGLAIAVDSLCREFSDSHKIEVTCIRHRCTKKVDRVVARTVYRILQEALHNIIKHSGAHRCEVQLTCEEDVILRVTDHGRGFDATRSAGHDGLGILSMTERVYGLRGTILIRSKPAAGTWIEIRVPNSSNDSLAQRLDLQATGS
jgi:signal transduction histidine kinase